MNRYNYEIYDLVFSSSLEIPWLAPNKTSKVEFDILIDEGLIEPIPQDLERTIYKPFSIFNADFFYLEISQLCEFLVSNTNQITISLKNGTAFKDVEVFFHTSILPVALMFNNIFLLRASALCYQGKVDIICSISGGGKSTLVADAIINHGAKFVADDLCQIKFDQEGIYVQRQTSFLGLWSPTAKRLNITDHATFVSQVRPGIRKGIFDMSNISSTSRIPLNKIIILQEDNKSEAIEERQIDGMDKVAELSRHTCMSSVASGIGKDKQLFQFIIRLIGKIELTRIRRSQITKIGVISKHLYG